MKKTKIIILSIVAVLIIACVVAVNVEINKEQKEDDKSLCYTVRRAVLYAASETSFSDKDLYDKLQNVEMSMSDIKGSNIFEQNLLEYLGVSSGSEANDHLLSFGAKEIKFKLSGKNCTVWVKGTDIKVDSDY